MSIERVASIFSTGSGERYKVLFGPGIEDVFFGHRSIELKFEEALYEELRRQGFDRIVFYSPHRSVFFFDTQSEELSRPRPSPSQEQHDDGRAIQLSAGPLRDLRLFHPSPSHGSSGQGRGMGDVFAVRMLDSIMREDGLIRSAVVMLQSETALRYFEDQRTLAGLVGEWTRLPSTNRNMCFFVFSVRDHQSLVELAETIPIPELRNTILQSESDQLAETCLHQVKTPQEEELRRMVLRYQQVYPLEINPQEFDPLCSRMAAEGRKNRYWLSRLQDIRVFDLETSRAQGWFSANLDDEANVWERMDRLTGLEGVKSRIRELADWLNVLQQRQGTGLKVEFPSLHMIFSGNPGTGKTTVARMFGEILFEIGLLKRGHLVEARVSDLVADHVGGTAIKTNQVIDRALDGLLFIDEAYALVEEGRGGFVSEAVETLLARMENDRQRLVVIAAGYPERMSQFRRANPGLERRFPVENLLIFDDFSAQDLIKILQDNLEAKRLRATESSQESFANLVKELWNRRDENFGNAGEIRNLVEGLDRRRASRIAVRGLDDTEPVTEEDIPASYAYLLPQNIPDHDQILAELDDLIGLQEVKQFLQNLVYRLEFENLRYKANIKASNRPKLQHMVFKGNPGTGKTTVARLVGKIYQALGLLQRGHCVEVTRVDLVAGYVGQTAQKTMDKVRNALDGILFIDEAYTLVNDSSSGFGQEAIDTLVKAMEEYQSRFVVVIAGYPEEIDHLLSSNPGLLSRFPAQLIFKDFDQSDLTAILKQAMEGEGYQFDETVLEKSRRFLEQEKERYQRYFGNARSALTLFETIKSNLAMRVVPLAGATNPEDLPDLLTTVLEADIPEPDAYILSKDDL